MQISSHFSFQIVLQEIVLVQENNMLQQYASYQSGPHLPNP